MGIKGLIHHIKNRYPLAIRYIDETTDPIHYDNLYLDATSLLIEGVEISQLTPEQVLNEDRLTNIFYKINAIVHMIQPTKTLFVSLEGPDPFAKVWRNRQRRFKDLDISGPDKFVQNDFQNLSSQFHDYCNEYFQNKIKTDPVWGRIENIVLAGAYAPGEAETKIFSYIRKMREDSDPSSYDPNQTHCIFTPDNDLIVMSLMSHEPYITLYFNQTFFEDKPRLRKSRLRKPHNAMTRDSFVTLDIALLREYIQIDLKTCDERIFDDIPFLCLIIANDYMPQFLEIKNIEFTTILDNYRKLIQQNKFIIEGCDINWANFAEFLSKFCNPETKNEYAKRNCSQEETENISRSVIECFLWMAGLYKTSSPPSWSWIFNGCFVPPLDVVIEQMKTYHPKFPLENDEYWDTPPSRLELYYLSIRAISRCVPQSVLDHKEKSKLIQSINPQYKQYHLDPYLPEDQALFILPNIKRKLIKEEVEKEVIPLILEDKSKDWSYLITPKKLYDFKSQTEIDIYFPNPKPFSPINRSNRKPYGMPSFLSGPFSKCKLLEAFSFIPTTVKEGIFSHTQMTLKIDKIPETSRFSNKTQTIIASWPYEQTYQINNIDNKYSDEKFTKYIQLPYQEKRVITATPIDSFHHYQIGPHDSFPASLCSVYRMTHSFQRTLFFTCKFPKIQKFTKEETRFPYLLNELELKLNISHKMLNNALFNWKNGQEMGLQIISYSKTHNIPFYIFINGRYGSGIQKVFLSQAGLNYIQQYIETVGPINLDLSDPESAQKSADFIEQTSRDLPFYISAGSFSFPLNIVSNVEQQILNMKKIENPDLYLRTTFKTPIPFNKFHIGQTVAIVDDRCAAPKDSTGVIIALDAETHDAWLIMHEFKQGLCFGNALSNHNGVIVNCRHLVIFN